ncbi:MAG: amidase family protein [Ilumatobacteraceae bacterium]
MKNRTILAKNRMILASSMVLLCAFSLALQEAPRRQGGRAGKGGKPPQGGVVKPEMRDTMKAAMYADNWFAMYVNGRLVAVDSIDFLPHNVVAVDLLPEYPMTIAVLAKDNADPGTGCEYGRSIGDGGFILKFADGTVTDASWKARCFFHGPIDRDTVRRSADILTAAGHDVVEAAPPLLDEFFTLWKRLGALDMILGLVAMLPAIDDAGLTTAWNNWKDSFPPVTGEMFLKALQERDMVMRAWTSFLVEHDVFVTPLMTMTTIPRRGDIATESAMNEFDETGRWGINLSAIALPALAFPVGSHEGTPLGVQIAARAWREDLLLAAGRDLERSIGEVQPVHVQW